MIKNQFMVVVNNIPYTIYPKSFEFKEGHPEYNTEAGHVGGGVTEPVHSENVENALGKVKFKMYNTDATRGAVNLWKKKELNVIVGISKGAPVVLQQAKMNNDPDFKDDGVEIEFTGAQMNNPL